MSIVPFEVIPMDDTLLRERFGRDLARVARIWRFRLEERLAPQGLTHAKWLVLLHLARDGGLLPQRVLVDRLGVEGPTLVRVLDGLERLRLIERHDCPDDRRTKSVALTPTAEPVIHETLSIVATSRDQLLAGISADELRVCRSVLIRIAHNMGDSFLDDGSPDAGPA